MASVNPLEWKGTVRGYRRKTPGLYDLSGYYHGHVGEILLAFLQPTLNVMSIVNQAQGTALIYFTQTSEACYKEGFRTFKCKYLIVRFKATQAGVIDRIMLLL